MNKLFFILFLSLALLSSSVILADEAKIVLYKSGCKDYFIAENPNGYYLLEWYGGYDPIEGDEIVGDITSFGFKNVYYPDHNRDGKIYVDDYLLSKDSALEKYQDKCS